MTTDQSALAKHGRFTVTQTHDGEYVVMDDDRVVWGPNANLQLNHPRGQGPGQRQSPFCGLRLKRQLLIRHHSP
jgi:hypothetical protein